MKTGINKKVTENLKLVIEGKKSGWFGGNTIINMDQDGFINVYYVGHEGQLNKIFTIDQANPAGFFINDNGWATHTTVVRINACFDATDLPYRVCVKNKVFSVRNIKNNKIWACGDGIIMYDKIIEQLKD